jgi:two-component system copper resistance phosphate regulon response regulator CusR
MLPGIDGFAILSALCLSKQTPVLMLIAGSSTEEKVKGFDLGADDYLVKPFEFLELLARVRTLLKRTLTHTPEQALSIADLEVNLVKHRAVRAGQAIDLPAKEFALLVLLIWRKRRTLRTTSTMYRSIW